jgi:hypothetical protein
MLPRFVRCKRIFSLKNVYLGHWLSSPLQALPADTRVRVDITLMVHPPGWDADAYVISHAPHCSPIGQGAVTTPAAAAGSRATGQRRSSTTISDKGGSQTIMYGPIPACARRVTSGQFKVSGLSVTDIMPDYTSAGYVVVLQEQVGFGCFDTLLPTPASSRPCAVLCAATVACCLGP